MSCSVSEKERRLGQDSLHCARDLKQAKEHITYISYTQLATTREWCNVGMSFAQNKHTDTRNAQIVQDYRKTVSPVILCIQCTAIKSHSQGILKLS